MDDFCEKNPDVALSYTDSADYVCDEELRNGTCDVALTMAPFAADFETTPLYSTSVSFWSRGDDPLFGKERLEPADLVGRRIAMPGPDFKCYTAVMDAFEGIEGRPLSVHQSHAMFWLYNYTLEGNGPAFGVGHLTKLSFFSNPDMRLVPFDGVRWGFGVSTVHGVQLSDAARRFKEHCLRVRRG